MRVITTFASAFAGSKGELFAKVAVFVSEIFSKISSVILPYFGKIDRISSFIKLCYIIKQSVNVVVKTSWLQVIAAEAICKGYN
ncbi:MAG TPA: hypothetical protein DIU41_06605 [Oscillibacter sp.]|nr:hypothetical protein [Oscillibacter sp.]